MQIATDAGQVEVVNEPTYSFGSVDNVRSYPFEKNLASESHPTSIHGVLLNGQPLAVFGGDGGTTGVHSHSLIFTGGFCYLALSDHVICFRLNPFEVKWAIQTDMATCFGVYYQKERNVLISHGEIEISRFTEGGQILWSASGNDIFTEGFSLRPEYIEAIDFYGKKYHFSYDSGHECG